MNTTKILEEQALKLPKAERASLVDALLSSLCVSANKEFLANWASESDARIAAHRGGLLNSEDSGTVFRRLRGRISE